MFDPRYLVVAAAAIVAAVARPPDAHPRSLALNDMINRTVCAIKVEIDVNPDRIPQKIKMLKCEQKTDQWCDENGIRRHDCCHHTHNKRVMECVEITDTVVVFNRRENRTEVQDVSVGCACMIGRSTEAPGLPPPP